LRAEMPIGRKKWNERDYLANGLTRRSVSSVTPLPGVGPERGNDGKLRTCNNKTYKFLDAERVV
jgi:hypothetical protein